MRKNIFIGFLVAMFATLCGLFIYVEFVSRYDFSESITFLKDGSLLGKVIAIAAIPNLFVFMVFIKKKQDYRAKGVLIATMFIAVLTLILKFT